MSDRIAQLEQGIRNYQQAIESLIAVHRLQIGYHGNQPVSDSEPVGTERSAKDKSIKLSPRFDEREEPERLSHAVQALWKVLLFHCNWLDESDREPEISGAIDAVIDAARVGSVSDSSQAIQEKHDHGAELAAAPTIPEYADIRAAREIEHKYRRELWLNHGHRGAALYGDDGEMQCHSCMPTWDYKRAPLADVESAAYTARMQRIGQALAGNQRAESGIASPAASPAQEEKSSKIEAGEAIERRQEEEK